MHKSQNVGGSAPEQGEQDEQRKYQRYKNLERISVSRQVVGTRICYRLGPHEEGKEPMTRWATLGG